MTRFRLAPALGLIAWSLLAAACSTPASPSDTTPTATPVTDLFAGDLSPLGSRVYTFTLSQESSIALTLASIAAGPSGAAAPAVMGLALGALDEAGACVRSNETLVAPALTAQLTVTAPTGQRCVEIFDAGNITGPVTFAVRIVTTPVSGTPVSTTPAPGTDSFSGSAPVLGSASRAIVASQAGMLSVQLSSLSPADSVIGLGIGLPRLAGNGCYLTASVEATTGSEPLSIAVDRGIYCVRAFDSGRLTGPVAFTLTTQYP